MKLSSTTVLLLAVAGVLLAGLLFTGASSTASSPAAFAKSEQGGEEHIPADAATAYFASGCFWCVEAVYESLEGVYEAVSGYSGGTEPNPTYEQVSRGQTHHAESVEVYYDPNKISFDVLVDVFFGSQDPTQVNGQGPDHGRQYRSIIFYSNDEEKAIAEKAKASLESSGKYKRPIAAEIVPFEKFWRAEDYHQNYERNNPQNPYVRSVSIPRLRQFQAKFPELLKDKPQS